MKCGYCSSDMPDVGYIGTATCPACGLVWEYEEGARPTVESIRDMVAAEIAKTKGPIPKPEG